MKKEKKKEEKKSKRRRYDVKKMLADPKTREKLWEGVVEFMRMVG